MKKAYLVIFLVLVLMLISCESGLNDAGLAGDKTGSVFFEPNGESTKTIFATQSYREGMDYDSYYWFYRVRKNDNSIYRTGSFDGFQMLRKDNGSNPLGLIPSDIALGTQNTTNARDRFSYGNWTFDIIAMDTLDSAARPKDLSAYPYGDLEKLKANEHVAFCATSTFDIFSEKTYISFDIVPGKLTSAKSELPGSITFLGDININDSDILEEETYVLKMKDSVYDDEGTFVWSKEETIPSTWVRKHKDGYITLDKNKLDYHLLDPSENAKEGTHYLSFSVLKGGVVIAYDSIVFLVSKGVDTHLFSSEANGKRFCVTFNTNGGNFPSFSGTRWVLEEDLCPVPEDPVFGAGVGFVGWYTDESFNTLWNFNHDIVRGNMTLYAKWTKTYEVKYETWYLGTPVASSTVSHGGTLTKPADPTDRLNVDGHFEYWCKDPDNTIPWDFARDTVTSDITLYAKWNKYFVFFEPNGATSFTFEKKQDAQDGYIQRILYGNDISQKLVDLPAVEKTGFFFDAWYDNENFEGSPWLLNNPVYHDVYLYARWLSDFTVSFDSNGGNTIGPVVIREGNAVGTLPVPTNGSRGFGGWYSSSTFEESTLWTQNTIVRGNVTLYAKWETACTVTFANTDDSTIRTLQAAIGNLLHKPEDPTRDGFKFAGWYRDKACTTAWKWSEDLLVGDITLYAKWLPLHTVTLDAMDGKAPTLVQVAEGELLARPTDPKAYDFTFEGWFLEKSYQSAWNFNTPITTDLTLYGCWNKVAVYFYSEGVDLMIKGSDNAYPVRLLRNDTINKKLQVMPNPTREGYLFLGWYDNTGYTGKAYQPSTNVPYTTSLYAKWIEAYRVTFVTREGATAVASLVTAKGSKITAPADPTCVGYVFKGWFKDQACTQPWNFASDTVNGDKTLYSKWVEAHTVTFKDTDGSVLKVLSAEHGTPVAKPSVGVKDKMVTIGWYSAQDLSGEPWNFSSAVNSDMVLWSKRDRLYFTVYDRNSYGIEVETKIEFSSGLLYLDGNAFGSYTKSSWSNPTVPSPFHFESNQYAYKVVYDDGIIDKVGVAKNHLNYFHWLTKDNFYKFMDDVFTINKYGYNSSSNMVTTKDDKLFTNDADFKVFNDETGENYSAGEWYALSSMQWQSLLGLEHYYDKDKYDDKNRDESVADDGISKRANAASKVGAGYLTTDEAKKTRLECGIILLPDNWEQPEGTTFVPASRTGDHLTNFNFNQNKYSPSEWAKMEAAGAVFIPSADYNIPAGHANNSGGVLTSSLYINGYASNPANKSTFKYIWMFSFSHSKAEACIVNDIASNPRPIRLVRSLNDN